MSFHTKITLLLFLIINIPAAFASEPVRVSSKPLKELIEYPGYSVPATVSSLNNASISSRISAEISAIPVQTGDLVEAGQLLVQLDCTDSELNLQLRSASLKLAEQELKRTRSLAKTSNASAQQLNQRTTEQIQAKIARNQARLDVKRCQVKAPFSGIVTARLASEGELATAGMPLIQLLDTQRLTILAQIPLNLVDAYTQSNTPEFHSDGHRWRVTTETLLPVINTAARNREARLSFTDNQALPGSAGRIVWKSSQPHIAADFLVQRNQGVGLFILQNDVASFHELQDAQIGHPARVELDDSTQVIIDGRFTLKDGDEVNQVSGEE